MTSGEDWERLADHVVARRRQLGMLTRGDLRDAVGDVSYRTLGALETGRKVNANTLGAIETTLLWRPGSARAVLRGGDPDLVPGSPGADKAAVDQRPGIVRDNWDDPQVRQLWELQHIPEAAKLTLVTDYLAALGQAQAAAGHDQRRQAR